MTNHPTGPEAHAASTSGATTLDPNSGLVTTINTYTVTPERAEEVLEYLIRSANETVRYVPGFLSFNFHPSLDRTQIVNYGQWESREAVAAARENPKIVALMSETAKVAGPSKSMPYELRKTVTAAGK
jgi:quinol monooxygenase YgiN